MADRNIGALDRVPQLDDDSLLVVEQQGQAMKVTGAQFKEFGRQAVIGQVQGYVDAAQAAAEQATSAVSAVTDMTVEAHASQEATVSKSTVDGKVHLSFGLPQGEKGDPGPRGEEGPRGPQGAPGNGLTILGHYDTEEELRTAVPSPKPGDAYDVGQVLPYDTYIFDGVSNDWRNHGPLSGGGNTILPENVVTTPGGAELSFSSGDGPHTVTFDFEEEPPLTADDVVYSDTHTVKEAMEGLFTSVSEGKALIASAITDKGVPTAQDAAFAEMADNIGQISTGSDTSDATATPGDILAGKTAYTAVGKVEGIIPTLSARTITPGTADQTIANGQYLGGTQTIRGDTNLTSSNIKKGVSIFGVDGAMESSFQAVLTVKADVGAVVTATNGDTEVSALSTTGTVTLDLPIEGTWKVTAQRGMAQYNTVVIQVTSQYSAELTAALHVEYMLTAAPLQSSRSYLAATTVGSYVLFGGGKYSGVYENYVDAYNQNFTHTTLNPLSEKVRDLAATTIGDYALFGGGTTYYFTSKPVTMHVTTTSTVNVYSKDAVKCDSSYLGESRTRLAATTIENYALFCGGAKGNESIVGTDISPVEPEWTKSILSSVDSYTKDLTHATAQDLFAPRFELAAAANERYALIGGGIQAESTASDLVDAYDPELTHTLLAKLSEKRAYLSAATAGNYILFAGGKSGDGSYLQTVDAYDMYLTRTSAEPLSKARAFMAASTVNGFAAFGGGNAGESLDNVDIYDPYLTRTTSDPLSAARSGLAAATIAEYILFGGGSDVVDVYRYV